MVVVVVDYNRLESKLAHMKVDSSFHKKVQLASPRVVVVVHSIRKNMLEHTKLDNLHRKWV